MAFSHAARKQVIETYAAIRNASPAYRRLLGKDFKPASLEQVQKELARDDRLVLEYFLGTKASYVIVVPPVGQSVRLGD